MACSITGQRNSSPQTVLVRSFTEKTGNREVARVCVSFAGIFSAKYDSVAFSIGFPIEPEDEWSTIDRRDAVG
jgi:hypothetical protein